MNMTGLVNATAPARSSLPHQNDRALITTGVLFIFFTGSLMVYIFWKWLTQVELEFEQQQQEEQEPEPPVVFDLPEIPIATYPVATCTDICAICLEHFIAGEQIRVIPHCSHPFHAHCVEGWLTSHPSCPTCRLPLLPDVQED